MSENHRFATDTEYLPELRRLVAGGQVRLDLDVAHLRGMDSPVAVEAETGRWAYAIIIVAGLAFWWQGWGGAAIGGAATALAYLIFGRRRIEANLRRRILDNALNDIGLWRKLWRHGGVSLQNLSSAKPDTITCRAPVDSWVRFTDTILATMQTGSKA